MDERRPENEVVSMSLRSGRPFDLTGFRLKFHQQDLPNVTYNTRNSSIIAFDVGAEQAYLNDIMVFSEITRIDADGGAVDAADGNVDDDTLNQTTHLLKSIQIDADGQQLLYINDAKHLYSILNQKKVDASEFLEFKPNYEETKADYSTLSNPDDAFAIAGLITDKQRAYKEIWSER